MKALDKIKNPEQQGSRAEARKPSTSSPQPKLTPDGSGKRVEGYEMQDVSAATGGASSAPIPYLFIIGFLIFIGLIALGFRRKT